MASSSPEENVVERGQNIDFPDSVIEFFQGYLGQPFGGFPVELQEVILKEREAITVRPGELLEDVDFEATKKELEEKYSREFTNQDVLAYVLYPKVFEQYIGTYDQFGNVSVLDTPTFLHGMMLGEEVEVTIEKGKTLIIKLVSIGEPQHDGTRVIYFELNGQPREISIQDLTVEVTGEKKPKADPTDLNQIGATMPGTVLKVAISPGSKVRRGEHLLITEAMKMETTVQATRDGIVKEIFVKEGESISTGDLLIELEG
ncbi:2-oxoglutarate carboxylase large subunit [Kurthia zopfii]|nr:2-oxoglutarate carboxylase large subunit [Kurthia zopfii]